MHIRLPVFLVAILLVASAPAHAAATTALWTPVIPGVPRPGGATFMMLNDVAATSSSDVWAVGTASGNASQAVSAHWNGTDWNLVPTPEISEFEYNLEAIDTLSTQDVWTVGHGRPAGSGWDIPTTAIVGRYDGAAWSVVPTPPPAAGISQMLTDVDMVSTADGWIVGWTAGSALAGPESWQPSAMRWQNGQWVRTAVPSLPGGNAMLNAVHARSATDVWAVGSHGNAALVMHWDGVQWSQVGVPHGVPAEAGNVLWAVTAVSATEVWAVGTTCVWDDAGGTATCQPLAMRLSGGGWQLVPTAGDGGTQLTDVVARSADDVWVVGYEGPVLGQEEANHVEHWDGQRFTTVPAPSAGGMLLGALASALQAAIVIPGTDVLWAVGWQDNDAQVIRYG